MLAFSLVVVDVFVDTDEARLTAFDDAAPRLAIFELMATVVFAFPFVASINASRLRFPETVTVFRIALSCWPSAVLGRVVAVVAVAVVAEGLRGPEECFALFLEILSTAMDDFVVLVLASAPTRAGAFSSFVGLVTRVGRRV